MFVSGRHGAVLTSFKTRRTLMPAAARQPPHRTWIDFMLATLQKNPPGVNWRSW